MQEGVVGRERELAAAAEFLQALEDGPAALFFEGEAGIGKTTLWRAAASLAEARPCRVLITRPAEAERSLSFAGLADLFEGIENELLAQLPPPQRRALDAALLRVGGTPLSDPRAIFAGSLSILKALAVQMPVLVAVDDLQWLDPPSVRTLQFVARRMEERRIGLLLTSLSPDVSRAASLLSEFDEPRTERVHVGPFTLAATHQLLSERLNRAFPRPTLLRIQEASGGNPLFALEIARGLGSKELRPDEPLPVPSDVGELVRRRVRRLPKPTRAALLRAAALARPTTSLIGDSINPAVTSGLIQELSDGRIAFSHPIYASAVYEAATPKERRKMHQELASRLADVEERGRHLALATSDPDELVAASLDDAAECARSRGAPETAAELQEWALELTPADDPFASDRRALAASEDYLRVGALGRARSLLETTLERSQDRDLRVRALHMLAQVRFREKSVPEAIDLLREAAQEAGDNPELRVPVELELIHALVSVTFEFEAARPHIETLISGAERLTDRALLAQALATATMSEFLLGQGVDESRLADALALEDPERHVPIQFRPTLIAGFLAFYTGRFERARSLLYPLHERLREQGAEADLPLLVTTMVWLECSASELATARNLAEEAYEAAVLTESETMAALSLAFAGMVEAHAGRVEKSRERLDAAARATERTGYGIAALWSAGALGFLELSAGNPAAAHGALEPLTELFEAHGVVEPIRAFFLPDAIEALVALGEVERAGRLTAMLFERGRELDRPWALATAGRCRAMLRAAGGQLPAALDEIEQALVAHERLAMPLELGRSLVVKGQIERRLRMKSAAKATLEQALEIFEAIGAALWAQRAQAELDRIGLRRAAPHELTEVEHQVAQLAASGMTNREVAAQLFLSPKTVEANLARVYRKLDIHSRAELGARLASGERLPVQT